MAKRTIEQKLYGKKIKKPNFLYGLLGWVWKTFVCKKYNIHCTFNYDVRKEKNPHLFISNHASREDYMFTGIQLLPNKYNFVAGYNEFYRSHLKGVFGLLRIIPKKNFTPDHYAIKEITRVIKNKGNVVLFPEGMNSISGANQPVAIGTGKLVKHFRVPVYYSVIKGAYLTCPKYSLNDRPGRIEVVFDRLFTPEEIDALTPEQIEDKINLALYHDDYKWNKEHKYKYDIGQTGAEGLETVLFTCPKCKRQHTMKTKGNTIYCTNCGNGGTLLDTYELVPFDDQCVLFDTQTKWFNWQREVVKEEVKNPEFRLEEKVQLGALDKYKLLKDQKTSNIVGEGTLVLDKTGLTYTGTRDGQDFEFHLSTNEVPTYGMCTDVTRFYTFYKGEFLEFYPQNNVVEKFFLATEELHRLNGGKWKDFKFEK